MYNKICSWRRSTVSVSPWLQFKVKLRTAFRNNRGLQIHTIWVAKSAFKRCIKPWLALQGLLLGSEEGEYIYMHGNKLFHHRSSHRKVPPPSSVLLAPNVTFAHEYAMCTAEFGLSVHSLLLGFWGTYSMQLATERMSWSRDRSL